MLSFWEGQYELFGNSDHYGNDRFRWFCSPFWRPGQKAGCDRPWKRRRLGGIFTGLLAASLFVAALSEVLARMLRTPVILLLVPMLIPEVPGEALYYTMYYLVQGYQEEFGTYSGLVLTEAGAIALGIILASHMARFFISLKSHLRSRGNKKRESNRRI